MNYCIEMNRYFGTVPASTVGRWFQNKQTSTNKVISLYFNSDLHVYTRMVCFNLPKFQKIFFRSNHFRCLAICRGTVGQLANLNSIPVDFSLKEKYS